MITYDCIVPRVRFYNSKLLTNKYSTILYLDKIISVNTININSRPQSKFL